MGEGREAVRRRLDAVPIAALLAASAAGWLLTVWQALHMGGMMVADLATTAFLFMWVGMMVAMMGPTIIPFVSAHRMVVQRQGRSRLDTAALVVGYFAVWFVIGLLPAALFAVVQSSRPQWPSTALRLAAGAVLVLAGFYQFTNLKALCLKHCRSPLNFLMTHDFGSGARGAFRSGFSHGLYCLGCCWALMAVLGIVGFMNLAWMAVIAVVFFLEKNWRLGVGLTRAVGAAVVLLGVLVGFVPGLLGTVSMSGGGM